VNGVVAAGGIFDSKIVLFVAAGCVIIEVALGPSNLETWKYGLVRTSIVRQISTSQGDAVFGVNVDNTTGPETELSGERTGDQVNAFYPNAYLFPSRTR
jgi:hypothetical protein